VTTSRDRVPNALRALVIVALATAPLALGAVTETAFVPLLAVCFGVGLASWARGHVLRAQGEAIPRVPLRGLLLAFMVLIVFQLLPLPPFLLRLVSPGSFAHRLDRMLIPTPHFWPISVSPPDTLRGLAFLTGFSSSSAPSSASSTTSAGAVGSLTPWSSSVSS
jgi:hypothetical protein